jgi:SRSO17 transposase
LTAQDQEAICQALTDYHRLFQKCFYRREQRHCSALDLCGQLSKVERKTIEPMLLDLLGPDRNAVRAVQEFIGAGQREALDLIRRHQELVAQSLGHPRGVVIVDGSGFPKQGAHSAGVAPVGIAPRTLADMSGQRWPIATIFEEAKGEVDMDHYETRTWVGWQHHMAHHFLMQVRAQLKKVAGLDYGTSATTGRPNHRQRKVSVGSLRRHRGSSTARLCRLSVASQAHGATPSETRCKTEKVKSLVVMKASL